MLKLKRGKKNPEKNGGNTKKGEKRERKGSEKGYCEQPYCRLIT
jgi:hypothetical protein